MVGKVTQKANSDRMGGHNVRKSDIQLLIILAATILSLPFHEEVIRILSPGLSKFRAEEEVMGSLRFAMYSTTSPRRKPPAKVLPAFIGSAVVILLAYAPVS